MPAIRSVSLRHPVTGVEGIWIDVVGVGLVGMAKADFPSPGQQDTTVTYGKTLSGRIGRLATERVVVTVTVTDMNPLAYTIDVAEGTSHTIGT